MVPPLDITNQRFGRLVAVRRSGSDNRGQARWLCQCKCGNKTIIRSSDLRKGSTQSCGCWQSESRKYHTLTHGHSKRDRIAPEYQCWANMLNRCRNPKTENYLYYGGRGIKVCRRWFHFENFLSDMGRRPSVKHRLDRINVNGNYSPANCRWGTPEQHQQNKRPRRKVGTIDKFTVAELKAELTQRLRIALN